VHAEHSPRDALVASHMLRKECTSAGQCVSRARHTLRNCSLAYNAGPGPCRLFGEANRFLLGDTYHEPHKLYVWDLYRSEVSIVSCPIASPSLQSCMLYITMCQCKHSGNTVIAKRQTCARSGHVNTLFAHKQAQTWSQYKQVQTLAILPPADWPGPSYARATLNPHWSPDGEAAFGCL
jgi:hypothetical protein